MNTQTVMEGFSSLPPDAQQQVADFIDFLKVRYQKAKPAKKKVAREALAQEAFIGMWRERKDMQDSSQWVRELRRKEWG
ncbi:DUF2281 domain-containing protein [Thiothrix fructosivorans]|uniref:DUF2281 domain-containing protein n=1 Tax=Thiothrix fructosivorans TaxID=111770 RepID=A0A8B0SG57_9GAMM|nr:DUF2281 domain-containing protein [Thiothrix fructosivorans]MBO0615003.1 DUF2281 domain-containing protein [Thiothrix fructosivorans]QTX09805.1 DUF2281 domain-containing protein [Thiothrix fructosivorans]